ncbi:MAG TPA: hypothetical protein VGJ20_22100 [Xanthobacteraceae bacterium]
MRWSRIVIAAAKFIEFLKLLDAAYPASTAIKLIMDNHSAHISKETRAWVADAHGRGPERRHHRWNAVLGLLPDFAPLPLPVHWSTPTLGGLIVTAGGLVFIAATLDRTIRAFDVSIGSELWHAPVSGSATATPMTYEVGGRQYVVIVAGANPRAPAKPATRSWRLRCRDSAPDVQRCQRDVRDNKIDRRAWPADLRGLSRTSNADAHR